MISHEPNQKSCTRQEYADWYTVPITRNEVPWQ